MRDVRSKNEVDDDEDFLSKLEVEENEDELFLEVD